MKKIYAALLGAILLAGCTAAVVEMVSATAARDLALVASGLQAEIPVIQVIPGAPTSTLQTVAGDLQDAATLAQTINTSVTANAAQPKVQQIEADVNAAVAALKVFPLPAGVTSVLTAAQVLLPVIEASVGLVLPVAVGASPVVALPGAPALTPDQARSVLEGAS